MKKQTPIDVLDNAIRRLEQERTQAREAFHKHLREVNDLVNPSSIIKNLIRPKQSDKQEEPETLTGNILGFAGGFLVKKLLFGSVHNPLLRFAGLALQQGVGRYVSKHPEPFIRIGSKLLEKIMGKVTNSKSPDDNEREN